MSTNHRRVTQAFWRRRAATVVLTGALAAAGLVAAGAPAQSASNLVIDSPASCQELFETLGATLGSVRGRTCNISSESSEVRLPAGSTVTVSPGWEVFVDSVVFFNEGTIRNEGFFRSSGDVVNNMGGAVFDNAGKVIVDLSGLNFFDRSVFVNRGTGRVNLNLGGLWVDGWAINRGLIDGAPNVQVGGTLVNKGVIRVAYGAGVPDNITGRQPVVVPYDAAPVLASSYPSDGTVDVRRGATIVLTFSEPVTAMRNWYFMYYVVPGEWSATLIPARAYRVGRRSYAIDPVGLLPPAAEISVLLYPGLVTDQDQIDPPGSMGEYFPSVRFATR
jgi:hypothetical protein